MKQSSIFAPALITLLALLALSSPAQNQFIPRAAGGGGTAGAVQAQVNSLETNQGAQITVYHTNGGATYYSTNISSQYSLGSLFTNVMGNNQLVSGDYVLLGPGTYNTGASTNAQLIEFNNLTNIVLEGAGRGRTTIILTNFVDSSTIVDSPSWPLDFGNYFTARHLTFIADEGFGNGGVTEVGGLFITTGLHVEDCEVINPTNDTVASLSPDDGYTTDGFYPSAAGETDNTVIDGLYISCVWDGIILAGSNNLIQNVVIRGNGIIAGGVGIDINRNTGHLGDCVIRNADVVMTNASANYSAGSWGTPTGMDISGNTLATIINSRFAVTNYLNTTNCFALHVFTGTTAYIGQGVTYNPNQVVMEGTSQMNRLGYSYATNYGAITTTGWTNNTGFDCQAIWTGISVTVTNFNVNGVAYSTNASVTGTVTTILPAGSGFRSSSGLTGNYNALHN